MHSGPQIAVDSDIFCSLIRLVEGFDFQQDAHHSVNDDRAREAWHRQSSERHDSTDTGKIMNAEI